MRPAALVPAGVSCRSARRSGCWLALLALARLSTAQTAPADPLAALTPGDLAAGKSIFESHCALCHGMTGAGGKGAVLTMPRLKHATSNQELLAVIREGIDGTAMPRAWQLSENESIAVAGYVRSLGRVAPASLPGDRAKGRAVFAAERCGVCHMVSGQGASLGPDLTEVGARRGPDYLRRKILDPSGAIEEGVVMLHAVARDGREIEGFRVNEDSFTIQIKDADNRFHSMRKDSLARLEKEAGKTWMPGLGGKLSAAETDDLVAYLASLRGGR